MNKFTKAFLISATLLFTIPNLCAADEWNNWARFNPSALFITGPTDASKMTLRVEPNLNSSQATGCSDLHHISFDGSSPLGKYITSTIMAAIVSGKQIAMYIDGCDGNRPKLTRVVIYK